MYSVSEAGILLGVCPATIRRWDKNGLIHCKRTPGGIEELRNLKSKELLQVKNENIKKRKEELQFMVEYHHMIRRKKEIWTDRWKG